MKWPWNNKKAGASESADRAADGEQVMSTTILSGDAEQDSRSLEILLDTIAAVTANIDLDSVLSDIVARSLQVTSAERALLLLGEERSVNRAKMLLEIHFKHQKSIQQFHKTRDDKLKVLDETRSKYDGAFQTEFFADERTHCCQDS